jgi:hypothetical protein
VARALRTGAAFAALLAALLLFRAGDPWRYPNDDNGAWYTAVARAHLGAGLAATRGQDFFLSRETGELVPYLHHPPLPGLILAAAFWATGSDSPRTARLTFALLHLATFALAALLVARVRAPDADPGLFAFALAALAAVPMSAYYGKMPNHEVPGLLFFVLGVLAWGLRSTPDAARHPVAACAAWTFAAFASWHAALCVAGWLAVQAVAGPRRRALAALAWVAAAVALVVAQLFWAGHGALPASGSASARFWFAGSDGASIGDRLGYWNHALGIGIGRYGQLPALLSIGWVAALVVGRLRGRRPDGLEQDVVGLGLGSLVYYLLFPRAVSFHAYQAFYLLPFVALSSSLALARVASLPQVAARAGLRRWLVPAAVGLTCVLGVAATLQMYRKPPARVAEAVRSLERQYR